ncbi:alpha-D-GlcNAc alpha-1,2-L-rhamnosyltransferase (plasmid) [Acinetobacter baumannii]|nr:alpha-D-GlcNAc alpha-1,2-L-rhamnosyltransferase [Acinetobacter baumannii]
MVSLKTTLGQQDARSQYPTTFFTPILPRTSPKTIKQLDAGL